MNEYTCYVCREILESEEEIPEISEDEALMCGDCMEWVVLQHQMVSIAEAEDDS